MTTISNDTVSAEKESKSTVPRGEGTGGTGSSVEVSTDAVSMDKKCPDCEGGKTTSQSKTTSQNKTISQSKTISPRVISRDRIPDLLEILSDHDIYVPERVGDRIDYRRMTRNPELDYLNSVKPPKDVFFPQTEKMFDFTVSGSRITGLTETPLPHRPILLFGSRPCDARAAAMLDRVFGWDYLDPYYLERKRRAVVVSIACREPEDSCFCTSMGGNPGSTEGSDLLLTDLGDRYLVEVITDKGATVMERGGDLFRNAEEADLEDAVRVTREAESAITRHMNLDGVKEALERAFDSSYWEEFANRCIGCGICTLLCPTCHCFDINDVVSRGRAWRERTWDTCQDAYYSVHASGHNPRPGQSSRQRNRIYHKFLYMDRNLGVIGCVGCGRCIRGCPVNIDIIEVVEGVREAVE